MLGTLTRRAALTLLASAAAFPVAAVQAAPGMKFRAIEVDVSPLRASGDAITAQWLAEDLPGLLRAAFAGDLAPGDRSAPVLVARIDSVAYGTPGSSGGSFMVSTMDYIEGAAVVKLGGRTQATYPLTTSASVLGQSLPPTENVGKLRADALAGVFARYLPGQIGL